MADLGAIVGLHPTRSIDALSPSSRTDAPCEASLSVVIASGVDALFSQQLQRRSLVPSLLNQPIEHFALVINCPPELCLPTADADIHFIQMPPTGRWRAVSPTATGLQFGAIAQTPT